jgi:hypothetical protein
MTVILVATFAVGLLTVHGLFAVHVAKLWMRYAIAIIVAYAAFLGLLKVWLIYFAICIRHAHKGAGGSAGDDLGSFCDFSSSGTSSGGGSSVSNLASGGGKFGGGGASGSWGDAEPQPVIAAPLKGGSSSGGSSSSSGFGLDLDGDEIMLVIIIIAVAAAIIGAGAYLIYAAPTILGDTAFNAVLASALVQKTKKVSHPDWVGNVLHATAIPFALVFVLTILMGWYAQHICPTAMRVRDAIHCASR